MRTDERLAKEVQVDPAGFDPTVFRTEAKVDHHNPSVANDHVGRRQISVHNPGAVQSTDNPADVAGDDQGGRSPSIKDLFHGGSTDELHDDLALDRIDIVQDRHGDTGRTGFRHQSGLGPDTGAAKVLVEILESVGFRNPVFLDRGAAEELCPPQFRFGPPLDQHGRAMPGGREKPFIGEGMRVRMTDTVPGRGLPRIRRLRRTDQDEWLRMRQALWPAASGQQHRADMAEYQRIASTAVFVAVRPSGKLAAFLEASIRAVADGCETRPVGYIEGWYVDPDVRRRGVGKNLVKAAETWARGRRTQEMGSDCLLDNDTSLRAHLALGYEERERLIHFRKWLSPAKRPPTRK